MPDESTQVKSRRAIYLLPNLITTMSLFAGFYSVVSSLNGEYMRAALAIIVAGVFDALDGRIARMTRSSSLFGVQYDSLSDSFAFGAAPAILMYTAVLSPLGRFGWLGAFFFMACGALRLARFNVQAQRVGEKHFTGLPIPAAAGMVAVTVLLVGEGSLTDPMVEAAFIIGAYVLGLLMVSTIPYPSLKQVVIPRRKAFQTLALIVVFLVIAANYPVYFLFVFGIFYVALGPLTGKTQPLQKANGLVVIRDRAGVDAVQVQALEAKLQDAPQCFGGDTLPPVGARQIVTDFSTAVVFVPVVDTEQANDGILSSKRDSPTDSFLINILGLQFVDEGLDFILVVGGWDSSNTAHLLEIPINAGIKAFHINRADCIKADNTITHRKVGGEIVTEPLLKTDGKELVMGVTPGASTPDAAVQESLDSIFMLKKVLGAKQAA